MNVRGLQSNHVCFTSFREVSWGYEGLPSNVLSGIFRGDPVRHGQFPQKQWLHQKGAIHNVFQVWDPSQNWVTNTYEDLRIHTKTYKNPWKLQSGLWSTDFRDFSWLLVTLRNPMKTLWGTLHYSFTGLNHWFCYFVKVCDWWPRVMKSQDCSRRLTKAHENIWKAKIGIWKAKRGIWRFMMANVVLWKLMMGIIVSSWLDQGPME